MKSFLGIFAIILLSFASHASADAQTIATDQALIADGNNAFAVELYAKLRTQDGNLFFSPESISSALAMTYGGACNATASEIAKTLHFMLPQARFQTAMGVLLHDLNARGEAHGYQFKLANALWMQKDYTFLSEFLKQTQDNYGAAANRVDFKTATEEARQTINHWIEDKTAHKIKDLIPPGDISVDTKLVLTNAVYFKGNWATQFEKYNTLDEDFYVTATQSVHVPLMNSVGDFNYEDGGTFQVLELPYKSNDLSMIIFLPKKMDGLTAFEHSITIANMKEWLRRLAPALRVNVTLPKFKTTKQFELRDVLESLGMRLAFSPDTDVADFSRMTGKKELYISQVIHKAYVDVNEEGTEAAAATEVSMFPAAMPVGPPPPVFRADHPFVFLIRDKHSGSILFMGRITDPSQ